MQALVEDFLQYLRHERGQAEHTQRTYAALLGKFVTWAGKQGLTDWKSVELRHLMSFLQHERERALANQPKESTRRLSSESVYLEIAALRAFYRFAETEKLLPANVAENLSLPRRWQRLPKALTSQEIEKLLTPETPETPHNLCDQAVLELAYASGLRLAELRDARLEHLHLDAGFINVIGKGNKERVVPLGRKAVAALKRYLDTGPSPARAPAFDRQRLSHQTRHTFRAGDTLAAHQAARPPRRHRAQRHPAHAAPQLRDASAGARRRLARHPGTARPRQHRHDGGLYARDGQPPARGAPQVPSPAIMSKDARAARPTLRESWVWEQTPLLSGQRPGSYQPRAIALGSWPRFPTAGQRPAS